MPKDKEEEEAIAPEDDAVNQHPADEEKPGDSGRTSRMLRMARKLMDRKELTQDTRELLVNVLATSDKAKTEAVRMVAREVRNYLEALELKEDMLRIMTSYSLEVSIKLKPLADAVAAADEEKDPSA